MHAVGIFSSLRSQLLKIHPPPLDKPLKFIAHGRNFGRLQYYLLQRPSSQLVPSRYVLHARWWPSSLGYYKPCISVSGSPPTSFWTVPIYEHSVWKLSTGQIKVVSCISCLNCTNFLLCFKVNYRDIFLVLYTAMCLFYWQIHVLMLLVLLTHLLHA